MSTASLPESDSSESHGVPFWPWGMLGYGLMIAMSVGIFFAISTFGESELVSPTEAKATASAAAPSAAVATPKLDAVFHVLVTLAGVIILGHLLGRAMAWIGQPPVIGEVVAGLLLGPSVLGALWPEGMHFFIPSAAADPHGLVPSALKMIAQVGIILYMFLVGLELNTTKLQHKAHSAVAISHASIVVPFILGAAIALWLFPILAPPGVPFTSFSLFMGVAMSITAFPVLARILTDRQMEHTELGVMALTCAASDDVTAWCLLALVVGVAQAQIGSALLVAVGAAIFLVVMFFLVRPLAKSFAESLEEKPISHGVVLACLAAVLLASLATEIIGIHAVFGAFLLGVMIPHDSRLASELTMRLRDVTTILLLPAFFAITGMRTEIGLLTTGYDWLITGAIIAVAIAGKLGGTFAAARLCGETWRQSMALGLLMNTRGLMQLIVLTIGLDLGVLTPALFSMMIVMAVVTTMLTAPGLQLLGVDAESEKQREASGIASRLAGPDASA